MTPAATPLANSVNRNKVAHLHEVVYNLVHWFDDKIFRLYPTWDDCLRAGVFSSPQLETFFGSNTGGGGGKANYKQCAERGIGRRVLAKMLSGTTGDEDIRKALENLPITERRRNPFSPPAPGTERVRITHPDPRTRQDTLTIPPDPNALG